jgi:hypothetical protein
LSKWAEENIFWTDLRFKPRFHRLATPLAQGKSSRQYNGSSRFIWQYQIFRASNSHSQHHPGHDVLDGACCRCQSYAWAKSTTYDISQHMLGKNLLEIFPFKSISKFFSARLELQVYCGVDFLLRLAYTKRLLR